MNFCNFSKIVNFEKPFGWGADNASVTTYKLNFSFWRAVGAEIFIAQMCHFFNGTIFGTFFLVFNRLYVVSSVFLVLGNISRRTKPRQLVLDFT